MGEQLADSFARGLAPGDRLIVVGVLRVIRHAEAVVNGVRVGAWVELRIEELATAGSP